MHRLCRGCTCPSAAPSGSVPERLPSPVSSPLRGLMGASGPPRAGPPSSGPLGGPAANALTGVSSTAGSNGGGRFFAEERGGSTRCAGVVSPPASTSDPGDACAPFAAAQSLALNSGRNTAPEHPYKHHTSTHLHVGGTAKHRCCNCGPMQAPPRYWPHKLCSPQEDRSNRNAPKAEEGSLRTSALRTTGMSTATALPADALLCALLRLRPISVAESPIPPGKAPPARSPPSSAPDRPAAMSSASTCAARCELGPWAT